MSVFRLRQQWCLSALVWYATVLAWQGLFLGGLPAQALGTADTLAWGRKFLAYNQDASDGPHSAQEGTGLILPRKPATPAPTPFTQADVAFVFVGTDAYTKQLKCEASIESLRSLGGWAGQIYLLTDALECFQHERWTECGLDASIITVDTSDVPSSFIPFRPTHHSLKDRLLRTNIVNLLAGSQIKVGHVHFHASTLA